eukprot:12253027-Alexandrium_andersonii.AAC.1
MASAYGWHGSCVGVLRHLSTRPPGLAAGLVLRPRLYQQARDAPDPLRLCGRLRGLGGLRAGL